MTTPPVARDIENGITHLNSLMEELNTDKPNIIETKIEINCLREHFTRAEQKIEGNISEITSKCLDEEAGLSKTQSILRSIQSKTNKLMENLQRKKDNLMSQEILLKEAEEEIKSKQRIVDRKREQFEEAVQAKNDPGMAGALLEFVADMVGPPNVYLMILQSEIDDAESKLDSSERSLSQARQDFNEEEKTCNEMETEVQRLEGQISQQKGQITSCKKQIEDLRAETTDENRKLQQLRNLMKEISKLAGRAEVLEQESHRLYDVSTLYEPLKSIVSLLSDPSSGIPVCASYTFFWKQVISGGGFRAIAMNDDWWMDMSGLTVRDVAKAEKKVMSPDEVKEDMVLVLGPHMNWQEMLNPAPLSVCLLGQLVLVTLEKDVSLVSENMEKKEFKHVRHPDSLRTSMVQVANEGWSAFNTANKNMDQIRLLTLQVPQHVKNAVKFIIGGSNEEIEELVPDILSNITRISETCTEKAQEVETRFTNVMELIGELQEACTLAKGEYEEKLRKARADQEVKTLRKREAEANQKRIDDEYNEMRDQLRNAREKFEKAMDSMPSAVSMMGMKLLEGMGKALTGSVGAVSNAVTMRSLRRQPSDQTKAKEDDLLVSEVERLALAVQQLNEIASNWLNGTQTDVLVLDYATASFNDVIGALGKYNGKAKSTISEINKNGSELCKVLSLYNKQMSTGEKEKNKINMLLTRLDSKTKALQQFCTMTFGASPMANPTPKASAMEQSSSDSVTDACKENFQFKVNQATSTLENARQDFKETSKRAEDASEKVANVIAELAAIKLDEVDFEKVKQLLQKGIRALGEVKTQWGKLVRFFQTMSNLIKCCMEENVKNFVQSAEKGKKFRLKNSFSDMLRDMIFTQASEANKIAFMVNNLSSMYVEVSEKHIMDQVASLGQLLALDPETEKQLIVRKQLDLRNQAKEATSSIADIVRQKQREFDTKIQKRIRTIETEMRAVLPPPKPVDPEMEAEMKRAIQDAQKVKKEEQVVDDWV